MDKPLTPFFVTMPKKPNPAETRKLLLSDARGIYIPRDFYNNFDLKSWGLNPADYSELSDPEHFDYWETWDELLRRAEFHDQPKDGETIGHVWRLEQDGDLWAIRDDDVSDDDEEEFVCMRCGCSNEDGAICRKCT